MIDRGAARKRFGRAAASYASASRLEAEVAARMLERLDYVKLTPQRVLDAGSGPAREARALRARYPGVPLLLLDSALAMLRHAAPAQSRIARWLGGSAMQRICGDIEQLPLADGSVGLVWANMVLHWTSDPLAALRESQRVLGEAGLLVFSTLGPDTLRELRAAAGGSRVHTFADMHDYGDMLLDAGFAGPVMDMERITLLYADGAALLADLRASGQTCALSGRARGLQGRRFRQALLEGLERQRSGGPLEVTYEVLYGHAWKGAPRRVAGAQPVHFQRMPKTRR